jgi:hypothetical protein
MVPFEARSFDLYQTCGSFTLRLEPGAGTLRMVLNRFKGFQDLCSYRHINTWKRF